MHLGLNVSDNCELFLHSKIFKYTFPSRIPDAEKLGDPWLRSLSVYFCCALRSSEGHLLWFLMGVFPLNETSIENSNLRRPVPTRLRTNVSWELYSPLCLHYFCFLLFNCYFGDPGFLFLCTVLPSISLAPRISKMRTEIWYVGLSRVPTLGVDSSKPPATETGRESFIFTSRSFKTVQ